MSIMAHRCARDIQKLIYQGYDVTTSGPNELYVKLRGPPDSMYSEGKWKIKVTLPLKYPLVCPNLAFVNSIYHPHVDEVHGSVCTSMLYETWCRSYDLQYVFNIFLPNLLKYPCASDPCNAEAAKLLITDIELFRKKVKEYIDAFAAA